MNRKPPSPNQLAEREVTAQVRDFLKMRDWRPVRMQRTVMPGMFQSGEPGCPDYVFLRYLPHKELTGLALCLWIEFKSPNDKRSCMCHRMKPSKSARVCGFCQQREWRMKERDRGATVLMVSDMGTFLTLYQEKFGWLHAPETGRGQLDLLRADAGVFA